MPRCSSAQIVLETLGGAIVVLALVVAGLTVASGQSPKAADDYDAFRFVQALDEINAEDLWPGFNPSTLPLAIFDGEQTFLFRHPDPPPEFSAYPDHPETFVSPGRYPAVVSNSTRDIRGVRTATVVIAPSRTLESTMLACVEEVFHVFWLAQNAGFRPDEMARYGYPLKDRRNLSYLLAEDEALARALLASGEDEAAEWASAALHIRQLRTAQLGEATREFEIALEMMEGTANYVASRAVGRGAEQTAARLRKVRPVEGIRWRFYDTGTAFCMLLDRYSSGWKHQLDEDPDLTIARLLGVELARTGGPVAEYTDAEMEEFESRAADNIAELAGRQHQLREDILARAGVRLIIELTDDTEPFRVERFDPINLFVLDGGEVVHPNYLTLSCSYGSIQLENPGFVRRSFTGSVGLTLSAGDHPLNQGVHRLVVTGLQGAPRLERDAKTISLIGDGLELQLRDAEVRVEGDTIRVSIAGK